MAGLTSTGITIKDVDEILSDIEGSQTASIDPELNVNADSVLGQLNGIYAAALAELWELVEEVYQSAYPDTASGQSLSYIGALTGTIRRAATKTEINIDLVGTASQTIPAGIQAHPDGDPDSLFELDANVLLSGGGTGSGTMTAVTAGSASTAANNDTFTITTPDPNLTSLTAPSSDTVIAAGSDEEADQALRTRREASLAQAGSSTVAAIRAAMLEVTGVNTCTVFENPTGVTDANGVPPYAIEVLVHSTVAPSYTDQDVADAIFANKPAGTQTYGGDGPHTVTDSQGNDHTIYFSEPTTLPIYVTVTLTKATDGTYVTDANVAQAIKDWVDIITVGRSVYASDIINVVADLGGVTSVSVSSTYVDTHATPDATSVTVTPRELATITLGAITVSSS